MLLVVSPAKSLDYSSPVPVSTHTTPRFLDRSTKLIEILREKSHAEIATLMGLSDPLAALNVARYATWSQPFTADNARQAAFAFDGDVYGGLAAREMSAKQLDFAQTHLRILSGLYGVLKPLDLMQPYRLEMGTRLANGAGKDLYSFWGEQVTASLRDELAARKGERVLINLASEEYFKVVKPEGLGARVVTPVFQERKSGQYKIVSFYAKRARGLMSRYAIVNALKDAEALKGFDYEGYSFAEKASTEDKWIFRREMQ